MGRRGVLIATDVAARGLHISGVEMVIIYDFSHEKSGAFAAKNHVYRIGRTGRAGKIGRAFILFTPQEDGASELVDLLKGAGQDVPKSLEQLAAKTKQERKEGSGKVVGSNKRSRWAKQGKWKRRW